MSEREPVVVVCGEALIDMIGTDGAYRAHPGGGPMNAAVALARLGRPVRLLTALGTDAMSDLLRAHIGASGVDLSWTPTVDVPTTLALVTLDPAGAASYEFYVQHTTVTEITPPPVEAFADVAAFHVGTLALAVSPTAERVEALVHALPSDAFVFLDPNCRPQFVDDREAYTARVERLAARSVIVKVSSDDVAWMYPERSVDDGVARLLATGAHSVLLTLGGEGAAAIRRSGEVRVASTRITVVDTVGAGDTFGAAALAWLGEHAALSIDAFDALADDELRELLAFATRAAGVTCTRAGADPPHRHEL